MWHVSSTGQPGGRAICGARSRRTNSTLTVPAAEFCALHDAAKCKKCKQRLATAKSKKQIGR